MALATYDRATAVKEFDDSKAGVRGLIESGKAAVLPPIFRHSILRPLSSSAPAGLSIPIIDLSLPRPDAVSLVAAAARDWGFFQVLNHGVPLSLIDGGFAAVRTFHELPAAERANYYSRDFFESFSYASNYDLYSSDAASWRDTIQIRPSLVRSEHIPAVIREEMVALDEATAKVAKNLMGLLSEGLGLSPARLEEASCLEGRIMVANYYPPCPEPEMTVGVVEHTDGSVVTVLVQDSIGGLQVKKKVEEGEEEGVWVNVPPVAGALVVNIGNLLQIMSNDVYKSVEHRALANSKQEARISMAFFFMPGKDGESDLYGPLPELISEDKNVGARYRSFTIPEYMGNFYSKKLDSKSFVEQFKQ